MVIILEDQQPNNQDGILFVLGTIMSRLCEQSKMQQTFQQIMTTFIVQIYTTSHGSVIEKLSGKPNY